MDDGNLWTKWIFHGISRIIYFLKFSIYTSCCLSLRWFPRPRGLIWPVELFASNWQVETFTEPFSANQPPRPRTASNEIRKYYVPFKLNFIHAMLNIYLMDGLRDIHYSFWLYSLLQFQILPIFYKYWILECKYLHWELLKCYCVHIVQFLKQMVKCKFYSLKFFFK